MSGYSRLRPRVLVFTFILFSLVLVLLARADTARKKTSVAESFGWVAAPTLVLDYGSTLYALHAGPSGSVRETNQHLWLAAVVIPAQVALDRWLSGHSRAAMWLERAVVWVFAGWRCAGNLQVAREARAQARAGGR